MSGIGSKVGSVSSRFVSQNELTEAQKKREEDIKAAYARMGQSPPPQAQSESEYDPRSLYERLQANKDKKQEAFDEVHKLGNQFRGLDEGETQFLAEMQAERREEEMRKKQQQENELEEFRKAAQIREASPPNPLALLTSTGALAGSPPLRSSPPSSTVATSGSGVKASTSASSTKQKGKRKREGLLGIVKKKAPSGPAASTIPTDSGSTSASTTDQIASAKVSDEHEERDKETPSEENVKNDSEGSPKRAKVG